MPGLKRITIYTIETDDNLGELYITHGYQNTKGEIYLAENSACATKKDSDIIQVRCEEISSKGLEFDADEDIGIEFIKIKDTNFKKRLQTIKGSIYKNIKLNNPGTEFKIDIDNGVEANIETWTILSIQEIREKIDPNQDYYEDSL